MITTRLYSSSFGQSIAYFSIFAFSRVDRTSAYRCPCLRAPVWSVVFLYSSTKCTLTGSSRRVCHVLSDQYTMENYIEYRMI